MTELLLTLVDKATSEYLIQTDWTVNMQICDTLNKDPTGSRDVIKQVTKRMKEKKTRIALYSIELLETLVKNCECVHPYVGGKEFQAEFIKLIQNKKTKDPVKERALELVQYWADSFQHRKDLPLFNQTNLLLRRAGIPFPPRKQDEPPLVFKPISLSAGSHTTVQPVSSSSTSTSTRTDGSLKEFSSIQESVNLAMEMLAYTNPEEDDPSTNEILRDLITTCKDSSPNVRAAIETGNFTSEAHMVGLLALNDELVKVQEMFDDLVARRHVFMTHGPSQAGTKHHPSAPPGDILGLAGAFGSLDVQQQHQHHQPSHTQQQPPRQSSIIDDLDFLGMGPAQPQSQPQQPYFPTQPTTTYSTQPTYPPQPQPTYPSQPMPAQPQQQYQNPFFDTGSGSSKPAGGSADDEFDMLAKRHSVALPPTTTMAAPLQPASSTQPLQNASLLFPNTPATTTAPYRPPLATTTSYHSAGALFPTTTATPSLASAQHQSAGALFATPSLAGTQHPSSGALYSNPSPLAGAQYPSSGALYTSYPQNPIATGPGLPVGTQQPYYPNPYPNPFGQSGVGQQPMQPQQPLQPQQPNYNAPQTYMQGGPSYSSLPAGYRPQ